MSIIEEFIGLIRSKNKEIEELTEDRDLWKRSENTCNNLYNEQLAEIKKLKDALDECLGEFANMIDVFKKQKGFDNTIEAIQETVGRLSKILKDGE